MIYPELKVGDLRMYSEDFGSGQVEILAIDREFVHEEDRDSGQPPMTMIRVVAREDIPGVAAKGEEWEATITNDPKWQHYAPWSLQPNPTNPTILISKLIPVEGLE